MARLSVFNSVSLDGYFVDPKGDMSWAHGDPDDAEWNDFVGGNARGGGMLVFGRVTYEMMASYWPTPYAASAMPEVAERMNALPKIVFSRTLRQATWSNTRLVTTDPVAEIARLKKGDVDMAILGSGRITALLAGAGLIDEYQIVMTPVALGAGRTMFEGIPQPLRMTLTGTRAFKNGNVFLTYAPARVS